MEIDKDVEKVVINHMKQSKNINDWNERRDDITEELAVKYKDEFIPSVANGQPIQVPKHIAVVSQLVDTSGLIKQVLK